MKVTVCQLNDHREPFKRDWDYLVEEVNREGSDLVVLPEMPFADWLMINPEPNLAAWNIAVEAHDSAIAALLPQLGKATVLATQPANDQGKRFNRGFLWSADTGLRTAHDKTYLPDEEGVWEASWYHRGPVSFECIQAADAHVGFQICTEMWFGECARAYGKQGAQIIASPRATGASSLDKWLAGGRALAIMAGAFGLSSNRVNLPSVFPEFGGMGWIVDPDGQVLASTDHERPAVTCEIDLQIADHAKTTYPRYVIE